MDSDVAGKAEGHRVTPNVPREVTVRLRRATLADAKFILEVRNDPVTVHQAAHRTAILEGQHAIWMRRMLHDHSRRLYVACCGPTAVGTGRLDLLGGGRARASFALAPKWRGRGLGHLLVRALLDEARDHGADFVEADVRGLNVASMTVMLRAGFHPISDTLIKMECTL